MSNTPGTGGESVTDTDDFTFDDVAREALAEIGPGEGTDNDARPAPDAAATPGANPNPSETPAAGAAQAPATPDHWSTQEQAAFDALPPETKTLVEKRIAAIEADYTTKHGPDLQMASGIRSIIDETGARETFAASGMNEVEGVKYLANLERFAREKPGDYLQFVAQHVQERFGLNPAEILGLGAPAQPGAEQPHGDALADPRVDTLMQRLDAQERERAQATVQRVYADAGNQVEAFRNAKDEAGNPLHPHLADVESDMARLMNADPKLTLDGAYEAAVWSNPTVRAKLQAAERDAAEKRARDEGIAAQKALRGNVRPGGSRSMSPNTPIESADDAARAALAELNR